MNNDNGGMQRSARLNDPHGAVLQSSKPGLMCGREHVISIWQPTVIIDSHMHIQSGRCAPLQYVQSISAVTSAMPRKLIEESGIIGGRVLECLFEPFAAPRAFMRSDGEPKNPQEGFLKASPLRKLTEQSKKTTLEIAADFMRERKNVYDNYFKKSSFYEGASNLILAAVVMTMDMEYAHIDGYFGISLYNALYETIEALEKNKPAAYWTPQHGRWVKRKVFGQELPGEYIQGERGREIYVKADNTNHLPLPQTSEEYQQYKKKGELEGITGTYYDSRAGTMTSVKINAIPVLLPDSETEIYENWKKQLAYTEHAVLTNPLKLLPMFHYDPRRWQSANSGNYEPMAKVTGKGIYLGFKMYSAQGYRPWDPWLPVLRDFYAKCCKGRIPIMNHCTPGGAATFEREAFRDFVHPDESREDFMQKENRSKLEYFNEHYVSPEAWRKVLDRTVRLVDSDGATSEEVDLHSLHLCLAHFGGPTDLGMEWNEQIIEMIKSGKYPNLYTDISSSFANSGFRKDFKEIIQANPQIKSRILFGTDWFMTLLYSNIPSVGKNFWDYCVETKSFLDSFDPSLWPTFTQYNPYRFYRLDEQIQRVAENVIAIRQSEEIIMFTNEISQDEIERILKEAAYIKAANRSHIVYEETP